MFSIQYITQTYKLAKTMDKINKSVQSCHDLRVVFVLPKGCVITEFFCSQTPKCHKPIQNIILSILWSF